MLSWPALLLAPLIALSELSIAYALVSPSCASQDRTLLHAVAAVSLFLVLAMTVLAWREWHGDGDVSGVGVGVGVGVDARQRLAVPGVTRADSADAAERPRFVAQMAVVVGALSTLVSVALWLPVWVLSPCY
jgi:hypothetical protein